jgi:hypothetical protein
MEVTAGASAFAGWAGWGERATGLEPATSSLGSWHSTTELRPQDRAEMCAHVWTGSRRIGRRKRKVGAVYLLAEASRKLRRSGSLIAGSPGETLSSRPSRIHPSSSPTRSNKWSNESTMKRSGW